MLRWLTDSVRAMGRPRRDPRLLERDRCDLLRHQIRHCCAHVPYYRRRFQRLGFSPEDFRHPQDLKRLPIITKGVIRSHYGQFLAGNVNLRRCRRDHSSGSTGEPFWTVFDIPAWLRKKYLLKLRARMECGLRLNERVAIFGVDPTARSGRGPRRKRCIFDGLPASWDALQRFRPQNIYGNPSFIFRLAEYVEAAGRWGMWDIARIFTSAEYLARPVRAYIERVFNAPVFDVYGCTEVKEIAWQCERRNGYHINADEVICEILDGDREAPAGVVGDIVVTDLRNRAMPLIRYRTGDRGRHMPSACRCGRSFATIELCAGRASDYLRLPDGRSLPPFYLTTAIEKIDGLRQFQFVQTGNRHLHVRVRTNPLKQERVITAVRRIVEGLDLGFEVSITAGGPIEVEANGKLQVVRRLEG